MHAILFLLIYSHGAISFIVNYVLEFMNKQDYTSLKELLRRLKKYRRGFIFSPRKGNNNDRKTGASFSKRPGKSYLRRFVSTRCWRSCTDAGVRNNFPWN